MSNAADTKGDGQDGNALLVRLALCAGGLGVAVAAVVITFAAAAADSTSEAFGIAAVGLAFTLAAAISGGLLGFLFGIPRTLQRESVASADGPSYAANTSLEQISDWLTKIIVGATLIQIGRVRPAMTSLANALHEPLGGGPVGGTFGLSIGLFSALSAFLICYLWTSVYLRRDMNLADAGMVKKIKDLQREVRNVKELVEDHQARSLIDRQLSGQESHTAEELAEALAAASNDVLLYAFQQAEGIRTRSWHDAGGLPDHDRTIPVFRALVAIDRGLHHRHFCSLAFALKDSTRGGHYDEAVNLLTVAIQRRGDKQNYALYEWNRAAIRILKLDSGGNGKAASADEKEAILRDLRVAAHQLTKTKFENAADGQTNDAVKRWMDDNTLDYEALSTDLAN